MIRYGIVGFGLHAAKRLMPGIAAAADSSVIALSSRNEEKARRSAAEFGVPLAFTSTEALCACNDVDAVFVSSPNACHLDDVLTAIRYGKPVLCEKPMALNSEECRQMLSAATKAGVLLGVAQCFRFSPVVRAIRNRVAAGDIGPPVFARAEFCFMGVGHARKWMTNRQVAGGGPIMDIGVHCVDLLRYALNDEIGKVSASAQADEHSADVEASALLNLEFSRGALAVVAVSTRAPYHTAIEIIGTCGRIRAENALALDGDVTVEVFRDGESTEREQLSNTGLFAFQFDAFSRAIEQKTRFEVPGEEGLRNALVLDAAYRSIATGQRETVEPSFSD